MARAHPLPRPAAAHLRRWGLPLGALLFLGACLLALVACQRRLYFPSHLTVPRPEVARAVPGLEAWWLDTEQGPVEAWWLPGDGQSPDHPAPAVLFAHGNAELIEDWPAQLAQYRRWGLGLLLVEYRGYGRSAGAPSQEAIGRDLDAWRARLAARPDVSALIYHGRSMGGGAVCDLARRHPPDALILQSTFTSLRDMAARFWLPPALVLDPFDNEGALRSLSPQVPILIAHGRHDGLVPYAHAQRLRAAAPWARLVTYEADHNDCPPDWAAWWAEIRGLLQAHGLLPG